MTDPGEVEPWLATACEQIAVDAFEDLFEQLARCAPAGTTIDDEAVRAAAHALIKSRIAELLGRNEAPEMVFQPIVLLNTGQTIGVEALSRFPSGSSPSNWFRHAADVGMSADLQLRAVAKAVEHVDSLPGSFLCVNVSAALLNDRRLFELLGHVDANRVVVEITQPQTTTDAKQLLTGLTALRSFGLRIAFDDVGTGFLDLQHVLYIEPEIIKLCPSLTAGLDLATADLEPARRLVSAAQRSRSFVVAKNVESQSDVDTLHELGIEAAQGFFLEEPQPAAEFAA